MKALVLCGGKGTRLWPLSRGKYPKQFLKLDGEESFLQQTIRRHLKIAEPTNLFILTNQDYYHDVLNQAKEIDPTLEKNIIVEPEQKNTASAIALGVAFLKEKGKVKPDEVVLVSPSDHLISPEEAFIKTLKGAMPLAQGGKIITFGVRPTSPETGYGYIRKGEALNGAGHKVAQFVEKPTSQIAREYLKSGNYFWNSGMFAFTVATFEKELKAHAPKIARFLEKSYETFANEFSQLPNISMDYAVMEKSKNVCVFPLDISWSDVGSWDNVYEILKKDSSGNAMMGDAYPFETKNSLLFSSSRLVATIGVEDLSVIETEDVVLVAKRGEGQKVKEVVSLLQKKGKKEVSEHITVHRPWGRYTVLEEGKRFKIKRIRVEPSQTLSLQKHYHRSEHWVVVKGTAEVFIADEVSIVHEGESIFVPKSATHRVKNPGKVPLEIIEVQVGEYLGEDDIIRLEDVYGRLSIVD